MAARDFTKFFKRRGTFVRQPQNDKKTFQRSRGDKNGKSDRICFRCGDSNHLIGKFLKTLRERNQKAFVEGSWSDSEEEDDEQAKDKTCVMAHASSKDVWECSICGLKSRRGFATTVEVLPRLNEIKFNSGVID
nr:probable transcriptional regulator SLK2 [Tanacetum cinerariifolium]